MIISKDPVTAISFLKSLSNLEELLSNCRCPICASKFDTKEALQEHLPVHLREMGEIFIMRGGEADAAVAAGPPEVEGEFSEEVFLSRPGPILDVTTEEEGD